MDGPARSAHVVYDRGNLKLYLRKLSFRRMPVLVDVGTADAVRERTGSFGRFLDEYEHVGLFLENVANPHLERHLERRGYARHLSGYGRPDGTRAEGPPSFWTPTRRDLAPPSASRTIDVLLYQEAERRGRRT